MKFSAVQSLDESRLSFYNEEVIDRSDIVYRFALALVLDKLLAFNLVKKTYSNVIRDIEKIISEENLLRVLLGYLWQQHQKLNPTAGSLKFVGMEKLNLEQRAVLFLVDVVGYSHELSAEVLGFEHSKVVELAGKSRKLLLNSRDIKTEAIGYLDQYLEFQNNSNADKKNISEELLSDSSFQDLLQDYSLLRGKLQYVFGDISLGHQQLTELLTLAEDPEKMAQREATRMERVRRKEVSDIVYKVSAIVVAVSLIIAGIFYFGMSQFQDDFRPLEYLGWETEAFEYDADGRLDFPLPSLDDIRNYLTNYKRLGFTPYLVEPKRESIKVKGATVIDYEPRKVAVVIYHDRARSEDIIALFSFRGRLKDLPKAPTGNLGGFIYQTYTSEKYNIVSWEVDEETLGMVVGRHSAQDLAEFVKK